jgi:acyl-coenzyme A thioesterase PaaI-like protein
MNEDMTVERVQMMIMRAPYHQWLGLKVTVIHDDGIELTATWREEWVVNPGRRYTHGGVLAALIDLAADWAMIKKLGRPVPTIVICGSIFTAPQCQAISFVVARSSSLEISFRHRNRLFSTRPAS